VRRSGFAEAPVLERDLQRHGQHRIIDPAAFFGGTGSWTSPCDRPHTDLCPWMGLGLRPRPCCTSPKRDQQCRSMRWRGFEILFNRLAELQRVTEI
jgi:hypothetical protein